MPKPLVSEADRAHFRRIGEAYERLREVDPAGSLEEVLQRLEAMERRLGPLAAPGLRRDDAAADREASALSLRWRRGRGIAA
jgi:hypothetical protein